MIVPMNPSDAKAVRRLLTATQKYAERVEQEARESNNNDGNNNRYPYGFKDFENFDEDSDDERGFRDISHYTSIDASTGRVKELWLGIINVRGITSSHGNRSNGYDEDERRYWKLSDADWNWLSKLDRLEHFKVSGCGRLPHRQLKGLLHLKQISCSICGNIAAAATAKDGTQDLLPQLPRIKTISLRCGFQPNPFGIKSLRTTLRYVFNNLKGVEKITIWRIDQQQPTLGNGGMTALQKKGYTRELVDVLLEELGGSTENHRKYKLATLELNRCGLTSKDFKKLVLDIIPSRFPSLQRLSLSSNRIDELPDLRTKVFNNTTTQNCSVTKNAGVLENEDEAQLRFRRVNENQKEADLSGKKQLFVRLRKTLRELNLSNNPIMEFLGRNGDEPQRLFRDNENGISIDNDYYDPSHHQEERAIVLRRFRRVVEFEKLLDWLRLFPKLSYLGYASCVHNLMRSTTGDFEMTSSSATKTKRGRVIVLPFLSYSKQLQRQIEYYLRINRGGRWLVEGGAPAGSDNDSCYNENEKDVDAAPNAPGNDNITKPTMTTVTPCKDGSILEQEQHGFHSLALWPNILEWSYRTSSGGCFFVPLPHCAATKGGRRVQPQQLEIPILTSYYPTTSKIGTTWTPTSSHKNATALYHLLRQGGPSLLCS
mmetsp:Transcript_9210/g.19330  ORF Transcript_9210/g.19330 Transcript_9210/m.19330 type:complete len:655 (-) Transcript_9210:162-2126(-)